MHEIVVDQLSFDPWEFKVTLREDGEIVGEYMVAMSDEEYERYGNDAEPEEVIKGTFNFLLAHEDPEMVQEQFKLSEVERHFPEYPDDLPDYL